MISIRYTFVPRNNISNAPPRDFMNSATDARNAEIYLTERGVIVSNEIIYRRSRTFIIHHTDEKVRLRNELIMAGVQCDSVILQLEIIPA